MKKTIVLGLILALFTMGCGHVAKESGFYDNKAMYKNWDHLKFSMWGHRNPSAEAAQASTAQEWWGIGVPYVPAK